MKRTTFFDLAKFLTRTQEKSLRALDYNISDLVHEAHSRLSKIFLDLYAETNVECQQVLNIMAEIYSIILHQFLQAIGSSNIAFHNISYAVGDRDAVIDNNVCKYCEVIIKFFKQYLPNVIDGRIGLHYGDIIEQSFEKVILFMGYNVRCAAQILILKSCKKSQLVIHW